LSRCMNEGVVEANWDWTMQTDEEDTDEMTVTMKCMDKASSAHFYSVSVLAASLLLIASTLV